MVATIERNLPLSNSIDKAQRHPLSSSSKILRINSTSTKKQYPDESSVNKLEALKSRKKPSEKVRRQEAKYVPENNDDKLRKLISDKIPSKYIINNSIDKTGQSSMVARSSKSNYQNLKTSKLLLSSFLPLPEVLPVSSSHVDEYDYKDDFEDYSDDFEEESEIDNDKNESLDRESIEERSKKGEHDSDVTSNLIISRIGTSDKDPLIDMTRNESYDNSPLLHRIMNRRQSDNNFQPSQVQSADYSGIVQRKIDFANATTINWEKISLVEKRYKMLKNLIGMEIVQFDLLDHHPIHAYDFYVKIFGNANYNQVQTQTGDDELDCYIQTEEVDKETVWTQIPYSDPQGWGIVNISNGTDYHDERYDIDDPESKLSKINHFEMEKFRKFISIAGQVFIDMMQSTSNYATKLSLEYHSSFKFSTGYCKFSLGNLVNSAKVTSMLHRENRLFVAFYVEQTSNDSIISRSVIVEFDICIPHIPEKILLCHNEIRCLCISPDGTSAIFVGLAS
ncbi:unnamed protein product [Cercopithifilaria johnstoni]|uniref:Uncharacterized protein n=1 Tax=Cercopithifilaria johnstoni TaxID=2874296 RepID=A0A8J2Q4R7_9BILA|nr:unnamed protein product [Cercopithifilaria johnstoni]